MNRLILIPFLVLADILSKFYFKENALINTGIAFGTFSNLNLLWIASSIIIIVILIYLFYTEVKYRTGLVLIISGALGNLIDRIIYGGVLDFINIGFWPAFNFADSYNVIGFLYIIFLMYRK